MASWYDNIYLPVVEAIRSTTCWTAFPSRTEADLYLWIAYHREQLAKQYELAPFSPKRRSPPLPRCTASARFQQAVQATLKLGWHRASLGDLDKPLGMTEEEFEERARSP